MEEKERSLDNGHMKTMFLKSFYIYDNDLELTKIYLFLTPNTLHAFMLYIIKCVSDTCHCVR